MVTRKILVIDDERTQAEALAKIIESVIPDSHTFIASDETEIIDAVENKFYNLAILDIRMDRLSADGIAFAKRILEVNPYARILFVSRFIPEYMTQLNPLLSNGNVLGFSDKKSNYDEWKCELRDIILPYYEKLDENPQAVSTALINMYSDIKNDADKLRKGERLEDFVSLLFQSVGYSEILKRTRDKSLNEVDLIIRNEIDDPFLSKFGKYILIECKNHLDKIDKNDFILFRHKLINTNGLSELGFFITTSAFKRTAYLEALRSSNDPHKVVFMDNTLLIQLMKAEDPREELKRIIDSQVKDN